MLYTVLVLAGAIGLSIVVAIVTSIPISKLMSVPIENYHAKYGEEITVERLRDWIENEYGFHIWQVRVATVFSWIQSILYLIAAILWWGLLLVAIYLVHQDPAKARLLWALPAISLVKGLLDLLISLPCWMITGRFPFERRNALAWLREYSKPLR